MIYYKGYWVKSLTELIDLSDDTDMKKAALELRKLHSYGVDCAELHGVIFKQSVVIADQSDDIEHFENEITELEEEVSKRNELIEKMSAKLAKLGDDSFATVANEYIMRKEYEHD